MNTSKTLLLTSAAVITIAVLGIVAVTQRKPAPLVAPAPSVQPTAEPLPVAAEPLPPVALPAPAAATPPPAVPPAATPAPPAPKAVAQTGPVGRAKEPRHDPDARLALSLVGADPMAEAYWMAAIFDSTLPDNEREDLMEDLNEDGLSDPKHPGPQDWPLIVNRIGIIEEVAPYADPFMREHLWEAYKDLHNLLAGQPVQ